MYVFMSSLLTKSLVQHHLSRVSPIQLRDFPLRLTQVLVEKVGMEQCKADNDILRRVTSQTAAWRILVGSYSATTLGAKLQRMKALTSRRVKPGSNPIHTLSEMADDARDLRTGDRLFHPKYQYG